MAATIQPIHLYFAFAIAVITIGGLFILFRKDIHDSVASYIKATQKLQSKGLDDLQLPHAAFRKEWKVQEEVVGTVHFECSAKTHKEALEGILYLLNLSEAHDINQMNQPNEKEKDQAIG